MRQGDTVEVISGPYAGQRATIKIASSDLFVLKMADGKEIPEHKDNFRKPVGSRLNIPYSAARREPKS